MKRYLIATMVVVLGLTVSIGVRSENEVSDDRPRFEVEGSWGEKRGPGGFAPVGFYRRTPNFRTGRQAELDVRWWISPRWNARVGTGRGTMRYETPVDSVCPLSLTGLLGPPPGVVGCPLGHATPLLGNIEDRTDSWRIGFGFHQALTDWLDVAAELGYGRMEWRSDDDVEATAMAECIAIGQSSTPVLRDDCNKASSSARRDGITGHIELTWKPLKRLEFRGGWYLQDFRYHIYRNELVPRVVAANCNFPNCGFGILGLRVVPIEDGSWSWVGARATWNFNERWAVFVNHEDGGSRPWQTTDVGLRLRF